MRLSVRNHYQISLAGLLNRITGLTVGVTFVVIMAACGGSSSVGEVPEESDTDTTPIVLDVEMADNVFNPSDFTVSVGQQVEFVVNNTGAAIHNMRIKDTEFKSEAVINPGAASSFTAKFTEAGVYTFVCDFHLPGMVGKITVEG